MTYSLKLIDVREGQTRRIGAQYGFWHNPAFMEAIATLHNVNPLQLQVFKGEELFPSCRCMSEVKWGSRALLRLWGHIIRASLSLTKIMCIQPASCWIPAQFAQRLPAFWQDAIAAAYAFEPG
jgi:hypothetical protein